MPSGNFQFQRALGRRPRPDFASFETLRCAARGGHPVLQARHRRRSRSASRRDSSGRRDSRRGSRRSSPPPAWSRRSSAWPITSGTGRSRRSRWRHHSEPFMPGDRTCNGGAYTFQIPGALAVADTVVIPMRVQDSASIRCIYAYVQTPTTDGQSAYLVKVSRDDGATWETAGVHGHRAEASRWLQEHLRLRWWTAGTASPPRAACRTTTSASSSSQDVVAGPGQQTVHDRIVRREPAGLRCGRVRPRQPRAGRRGVRPGARRRPGRADVRLRSSRRTIAIGATVRPTIWPTAILNEGDSLAFDILAVASPDPGSDLTVVIQT